MQNVTWPRAAGVRSWSLTIAAHSRGGEGRGGHYAFERGAGARWAGRLEVVPLDLPDALTMRAFLHSLRGRSGSFLWPIPAAVAKTTGTITADADAGADSITASATVAAAAQVGSYVVLGDLTATGQLVRVVSKASPVLGIRPRLRAAYANGATVAVGRVSGRFRLDMDTPPLALDGHRSQPLELQIAEAY